MSSCPPAVPGILPGSAFHYVSLLSTIAVPLFVVVCIAVFVHNKNKSMYLRKRSLSNVLAFAISTAPVWAVSPLFDYLGPDKYPCALFGFLIYSSFTMLTVPIIVKLLRFRNGVSKAYLLQEAREVSKQEGMHSLSDDSIKKDDAFTRILTPEVSVRALVAHLKATTRFNRSRETEILACRFAQSNMMIVFWLSLCALPFMVAYAIRLGTDPAWHGGCYGCDLQTGDAAFFIVSMSFNTCVAFLTNPIKIISSDPLRMIRECMLAIGTGLITITAFILYIADPGNAYTRGIYNYRSIYMLGHMLAMYFQSIHQVIMANLLRTKLVVSSEFDIADKFHDVMQDKQLKAALRNHLNDELSSEILLFIDAVDEYKAYFGTSEPGLNNKRKRIMVEFYIKKSSMNEINISGNVRDSMLMSQFKDAEVHYFDQAYAEVKQEFLRDGFPRFLTWAQRGGESDARQAFLQKLAKETRVAVSDV